MGKPTTRQVRFSQSVLSGMTYEEAKTAAGYALGSNGSVIADQCRSHGLLPDHQVLQREVQAMQKEASERVLRRLADEADVFIDALVAAARDGNVQAIVQGLDRLMGKPPAKIEFERRTEEFRARLSSGELDADEVLEEARRLLGLDGDDGHA